MDFMMPDMDGYEVTGMITADPNTATIPVVMCTGHDTPQDRAPGQGERRQRLRDQACRRCGPRRPARRTQRPRGTHPVAAAAEIAVVADAEAETVVNRADSEPGGERT